MNTEIRILAILTLFVAGEVVAQNAKVNDGSLTIGGFVNSTLYVQDQAFSFGNGQNAELPVPPQFGSGNWFFDADLRNTRLWLNFSGPQLSESWKVKAYLEGDFFGGYNGNSFVSAEQFIPRLRLAYADLIDSSLTIRIGQAWAPLFGYVPVSLSHIAFPLGWGSAGLPGWRFPGLFIYYTLTETGAPTTAQFQFAAMKPSWFTAPAAGNNDLNSGMTAGNASLVPQLEARLNLDVKISPTSAWGGYIVAHFDRKDLAGVNHPDSIPSNYLNGYAAEIGARYSTEGFSFAGNAYYGKAIGQQLGLLTQAGDIGGVGGWTQIGYSFDPHWGVYAFYGIDSPNKDDVVSAGATRWQNQTTDGLIRYKTGPYALGVEWLHAALKTGPAGATTTGNQISFSLLYNL